METPRLRCENCYRYFARALWLVVALLMCLGVFLVLPLRASGMEVPSALTRANMPSLHQATNGTGHLLEGTYLLTPGEEAEDADKDPLKSELLTMLLLTLCFGLSVGWLFRNAHKQGALCSLAVVGSSLAPTSYEDLPFLGVFRL